MRTPVLTLCSALAVTVLSPVPALASAARAPGAAAGTVAITPSALPPGTEAALQVSGCAGRTGRATSAAFVDAVPLAGVAAGLVGDARVRSTADPGTYAVSVHCDGEDARAAGSFEVVPASADNGDGTGPETYPYTGTHTDTNTGTDTGTEAGTGADTDAAEPPASPSAPVRAGGGWTATHPQPYPRPRFRPHPAAAHTTLARTAPVRTAASHEGDGAYAVGLVLAGGAVLALTGQALRMRRRRKGPGDGDAG
ncbi:hypothetical protein [Streptomyces monomycini]|uniref:hypothetical protein n=1 Tax=Streptomyces monomycini TaxID=371720 RepID=UPI0012FEDD1B|nr:hypothetical protein [Streptomyces monomycini]